MSQLIINRGRGPEIAGTRITVYDVLDYSTKGYHPTFIASLFRVSSHQVQAALEYIAAHKDEVMAEYRQMLAHDAEGNPPEVRAKETASRAGCSRGWPSCGRPGTGGRTVRGILADNNVEGHVNRLLLLLRGDEWGEVWASLGLTVESFDSLGLTRDTPDAVLWHVCQQRELILITANRLQRTADSLEATIQRHNSSQAFPVVTLANGDRILDDRNYAERAVVKLLEYLLDVSNYRGTGRLYVP